MATSTVRYDVKKLLSKKKKFFRMGININEYYATGGTSNNNSGFNGEGESKLPNFTVTEINQDQFIKELYPQTHIINNPDIYPNKPLTKSGLPVGVVSGDEILKWESIARVSVPEQNTIAQKQRIHLMGNPIEFTKYSGDDDVFTSFKEGWNHYKIQSGMSLVAESALTTGDGAIYFYLDGKKRLKYKTWSYKYGDSISHHPESEDNGKVVKENITRHFNTIQDNETVETVEVYDDEFITTYTKKKGDDWDQKGSVKHGFRVIPVAYHKEDDVAWGIVQDICDQVERSLSDLREANKYFAFTILFLKGGGIQVLPNKTSQGKVIEGNNSDSDVKAIEPQSKPDAFVTEVNKLTDKMHTATGTVVIQPEMLKGGDQSGAYIKNLYFPAIQKAMESLPRWHPFIQDCIDIVIDAVGREKVMSSKFDELRVSYTLDPYIPQNDAETILNMTNARAGGFASVKTTSDRLTFGAPDEYARIQKEKEDALKAQLTEQPTSE